jgi:hypothetical protein
MLTKNPHFFPRYFCNCCNTTTNNRKDFEKHLLTAKHSKLTNVNTLLTEKSPNFDFICQEKEIMI